MTKTDGSNAAVFHNMYKKTSSLVQKLFICFREFLVYYLYRAGAMRKTDAVAIAADNPTVDL